MASCGVVDSAALFSQRIAEYGLGHLAAQFQQQQWTTFQTFGNASGFVPGATEHEDVFFRDLVTPLGLQRDAPEVKLIRGIYKEAYILVAADLKDRYEGNITGQPRQLPPQEIDARWRLFQSKFSRATWTDHQQPSNQLVNTAASMVHFNVLGWIPVERCTSLDQELQGIKLVEQLVWDANNKMTRQQSQEPLPNARLDADQFWHWAMERRGRR